MLDYGFYNMDCLEGMKQFPDKYFNLAVVDPPYGSGLIEGEVPENMTKVIVEPDKAKIREYLANHEAKWSHIGERGRHIEIK